jgi:hypothetical protein
MTRHRYKLGTTLHGIIYLCRITDEFPSEFHFRLLEKICGNLALKNVVIATTMWDTVTEEVGTVQEQQLHTFFQPALERHNNTVTSAQSILRTIFNNHPMPLSLQREIVDDRKEL